MGSGRGPEAWGQGLSIAATLIFVQRDAKPNTRDREHPGELGRKTADLERAAVTGGTTAAGFVDDESHPARDALDRLEVQDDAMIAGCDQIEQVTSKLANLRFLDQCLSRAGGPR